MIYSDWREELILTEGAKTRFIIKGLKKIKGLIKKPKITKASGVLNVNPELIKQFPGVNIKKLAYPDYKANKNPKLAKAIKIFKDKLERAKMPSSSPYSTYVAPKVEIRSPIPPKLSQQIKSNLNNKTFKKLINHSEYIYVHNQKIKDEISLNLKLPINKILVY